LEIGSLRQNLSEQEMQLGKPRQAFDLNCLTVDVEWAHDDVLADLVGLIEARGLKATFFCTHSGILVPGHERALHPNFSRSGDTMRLLGTRVAGLTETEIYRHVVQTTRTFCREAVGIRGHRQFFDSALLPIYRDCGLEYESSQFLPLAANLVPVRRPHDIIGIPIYYIDHSDLSAGYTGFDLGAFRLDRPGLKVFDFHPNTVFINAATNDHYNASKACYHNPARLLAMRHTGQGVRTLLVGLLDLIATRRLPTANLRQLNELCRGGEAD
jgi:hypothetical protein